MGGSDAVLLGLLSKSQTVNCFIFEENTRQRSEDKFCLSRALYLPSDDNHKPEKGTLKLLTFFITIVECCKPNLFKSVHMNDHILVEDLLPLNFLLHDRDIVDAKTTSNFVCRSVQKCKIFCTFTEKQLSKLSYGDYFCCFHRVWLSVMFNLFKKNK